MNLIKSSTSISPACDVPTLEDLEKLVNETKNVPGIKSYKVGFELGLSFGLPRVVEVIREKCQCGLPIIYDHQKAGTDIPDTGVKFARTMKSAGIDCVILFPQAGPVTQKAWIEAMQEENLSVMVGGLMTHKGFIAEDGGYLRNESVNEVYQNAARIGVTQFVVPGNKPSKIAEIRELIEAEGVKPAFFSPGFVTQGGSIEDAIDSAGGVLHAFVGRAIYNAENIEHAARELCDLLPKE